VKRITLLVLLAACGGKGVLDCPSQSPDASAYVPFETRCTMDIDAGNPFEVEAWGDLELPDAGIASVPAFWGQDFTRQLTDGGEQLTPNGDASWRVRFLAPGAGSYRWRWRYGTETTDWQTITVGASGSPGLLHRSSDPMQLAYDDGTPYVAIGENVGWYDTRGTYAFDDWFGKLAAQRATYARVWMANWSLGIEWDQLGHYRLDRAWQLDQVLSTSPLELMLCLQPHGEFSTTFNSNWMQNPYNKINGGPLEAPTQFFLQPDAKRLFKQRLRYIVGRYSAYPQLLAWELFNEVDLTLEMDPTVLRAWHQEMAQYVRSLDPNRHLITTSLSGGLGGLEGLDTLYSLDELDFAQLHLYGSIDFTTAVPQAVQALAQYKKPILAAEVGVSASSGADTLAKDPTSSGFHDYLWSGLLSGAMGTGMAWWWDSVTDPQNLYPQFAPIAQLTPSLDHQQPCTNTTGTGNLRVLALCGRTSALAWVKNLDDLYLDGGNDALVSGAQVTLVGVPDGAYRVQFVDPWGGPAPAETNATASGAQVTVPLPDFRRDLAFRLIP
jgi:hypothetical protein